MAAVGPLWKIPPSTQQSDHRRFLGSDVLSRDSTFVSDAGGRERSANSPTSEEVKDVVFVRRLHQRFQKRIGTGAGRRRGAGSRGGLSPGTGGISVSEAELDRLDANEAAAMNELDENGWAHIHQAAFRGFVKSVERFISADHEQLDLETGDDLKSTPILLAVMSGNLETVKLLVGLGAKITALNTQNHGVVELCAFKQFIDVLEYFIEIQKDQLPVWKKLIKFLASDTDEEAEAAAKCLRRLTQGSEEEPNPNWKPAYENGIVPTIVRVIKGSIGDEAKISTLEVVLNLIEYEEVKEQLESSGGIQALIRLLKSQNNFLIQLSAQVLKELCTVKKYADNAGQNNAIPALLKVIQTVREPEVLVQALEALGNVVQDNQQHQQQASSQPGAVSSIASLFEDQVDKSLLEALTGTIGKLSRGFERNQNAFIDEGAALSIISLVRVKHKSLQLGAVAAISCLAENNSHTQKVILDEGCVSPLMQLLKRSRQRDIQEKTATALWALAGSDIEELRNMATLMGVQLLIEFLSSLSEELHYIGAEAMGVLAQGPLNKQSAIAQSNGVHPLVRLLRSDKEHIVLSVIRTMRYLCVGVGYVPHPKNQTTLAHSRGLKFLVALMVHSRNELIQVEAAHTLGCAALGHADNQQELQDNLDFSYVRILKMLYSEDAMVRLLAGAALASFAYNNLAAQKAIADQGGVRFSCFVPFLQSSDEFFRCNAAFQVVVLSRIIPDEEQAISSAAGIKLLTDLLQDSRCDDTCSLAADCIARLAHTRAGVPAAFISIDTVRLLCCLLTSPGEQVRGCAAICLGYLSYNPHAQRQLLSRCRVDPYMMKIMKYYTSKTKLSPDFIEGWKHYKQIGLPPIEEGKTSLVGRKNIQYKDFGGRPLTITTLDDGTGGSSNIQPSPTNYHSGALLQDIEDKSNVSGGRSSRTSRLSHQSLTPRQRHLSLSSHRSRQNSVMSNELIPEIMD